MAAAGIGLSCRTAAAFGFRPGAAGGSARPIGTARMDTDQRPIVISIVNRAADGTESTGLNGVLGCYVNHTGLVGCDRTIEWPLE